VTAMAMKLRKSIWANYYGL